jgi:hypothetical protein
MPPERPKPSRHGPLTWLIDPRRPDEEELVETREVDDGVRTHFKGMTDLGAHEAGEGGIP